MPKLLMPFINEHGWILPSANHKTYAISNSAYYKCGSHDKDELINYNRISSYFNLSFDARVALEKFSELKKNVTDSTVANLLLGPHIPFILPKFTFDDIGEILEKEYFSALSSSLVRDQRSFKYVLRGPDDTLMNRLHPTKHYQNLMALGQDSSIIGYYFPLALEGYAPSSQENAFMELFEDVRLAATLSGPIEIASSLIANNNLLLNKDSYSHILTASGVFHDDKRLVLCFKSYGSNLESWLMSKLLTPKHEQVSEQWSAGVTIYSALN